jgi:hypothetical protein
MYRIAAGPTKRHYAMRKAFTRCRIFMRAPCNLTHSPHRRRQTQPPTHQPHTSDLPSTLHTADAIEIKNASSHKTSKQPPKAAAHAPSCWHHMKHHKHQASQVLLLFAVSTQPWQSVAGNTDKLKTGAHAPSSFCLKPPTFQTPCIQQAAQELRTCHTQLQPKQNSPHRGAMPLQHQQSSCFARIYTADLARSQVSVQMLLFQGSPLTGRVPTPPPSASKHRHTAHNAHHSAPLHIKHSRAISHTPACSSYTTTT